MRTTLARVTSPGPGLTIVTVGAAVGPATGVFLLGPRSFAPMTTASTQTMRNTRTTSTLFVPLPPCGLSSSIVADSRGVARGGGSPVPLLAAFFLRGSPYAIVLDSRFGMASSGTGGDGGTTADSNSMSPASKAGASACGSGAGAACSAAANSAQFGKRSAGSSASVRITASAAAAGRCGATSASGVGGLRRTSASSGSA